MPFNRFSCHGGNLYILATGEQLLKIAEVIAARPVYGKNVRKFARESGHVLKVFEEDFSSNPYDFRTERPISV